MADYSVAVAPRLVKQGTQWVPVPGTPTPAPGPVVEQRQYNQTLADQQRQNYATDLASQRAYADQKIGGGNQAGPDMIRTGITYDTATGGAQIKYGVDPGSLINKYLGAFGSGGSGGSGGGPTYVPPPQPTWEDTRASIDAAFARAKEITGQNNRASLGALRNYMASSNRAGSGTEGRAAGRIVEANESRLSNLARDNEIGAATQKIDFTRNNYDAARSDAGKRFDSQYQVWNANNRNAIDREAANRQSIISLINAAY